MSSGYDKGIWAERMAAVMLTLKGYRVRALRYKTPRGEVDLVVTRGSLIVFVEVKFRPCIDAAAYAIHAGGQKRIRDAAALYLAAHPAYNRYDARFDVVLIAPWRWPRHMRAAF
jgi:putative endonuclease